MISRVHNILTKVAQSQASNSRVLGAAAALLTFSAIFTLQSAVAEDAAGAGEFNRRLYLGLNGGVSNLDPVSRTSALDTGDQRGTAASLFVGYDISPRVSIEGYYADLGEAEIDFLGDDVGGVEYQVYGVNLLGYVFNSQEGGLNRRQGFSGYLRAGIGGMSNESNLDYERDHDVHFTAGTGIEYGFGNGFGLRAELNSFDSDAQYLNIGLLKRFGSPGSGTRVTTAATTPAIDEQPKVATQSVVPDTDGLDFPIAYFAFDKYNLSDAARSKLDVLVNQLATDESVTLRIQGHADATGTHAYNEALSKSRATAVRNYLVSKGISRQRLSIDGFGETKPVDTNDTVSGRTANRRVEFTLQ